MAHVAMGRIKIEYEWDWEGAERAFLRAIELNPHLAVAHTYYAFHLLMMGRAESLAEIARAKELDPLSRLNPTIEGMTLITQRRYAEAVVVLDRVVEADPAYYPARWFLGMAYEQLGAYAEAISLYEQASAANRVHMLGRLGYAFILCLRRFLFGEAA